MAKSQKKKEPKYSEKNPVPTEYYREWRKGTKWNEKTPAWYMECKLCGQMQRTSYTAFWVICSTCCNEMVPWEDTLPKAILKERNRSTQKPQGWHFMNEYVDKEGNVFHKGVEQPKLKGTRDTTVIIKKPKMSKKEKQERRHNVAKEIYSLKGDYKKARWKKDKTAIERKINKLQREMKKL